MRCAPKECNGKNLIAWQFSLSDQLEFSVTNEDDQVYPCLKIITTECDDEDSLKCPAGNSEDNYYLTFKNYNRFSSITVTISLWSEGTPSLCADIPLV